MTAFVFPGQGSQFVGMGKDLHDNFPEARLVFEEAADAVKKDIKTLCFDSDEQTLSLTFNAQPAILTVSIAALRVLVSEKEISADFASGHSLGEYSALVSSGAIDFPDAVRIVSKRGELMQKAVPPGKGAMAAVIGMKKEQVENICENCSEREPQVWPANYNSPEQTVISGHADAVQKAAETALGSGAKRAPLLKVSAPFHCPLMEPAAEGLAEFLENINVSAVKTPVVTNLEAAPNSKPERVKNLLLKQITNPVRWLESVEYMRREGAGRFIEIGPGKALCGLIKRTVKDAETFNLEKTEHLHRI